MKYMIVAKTKVENQIACYVNIKTKKEAYAIAGDLYTRYGNAFVNGEKYIGMTGFEEVA
jgi:hypothetical protein